MTEGKTDKHSRRGAQKKTGRGCGPFHNLLQRSLATCAARSRGSGTTAGTRTSRAAACSGTGCATCARSSTARRGSGCAARSCTGAGSSTRAPAIRRCRTGFLLSGRIHVTAGSGDRATSGHVPQATLALCALKALAGVSRRLLSVRAGSQAEKKSSCSRSD